MTDKNPEKIKNLFNEIAKNYDFMNNVISFFTHGIVKKSAICTLKINKNSKVLDLCSGTGDLGAIIKNKDKTAEVWGVDFSSKMIELAKKKNKDINYILADALNLPFENETFDYVVMGFGLRNIENQNAVIKEIYRVLKPKGKFLHLDFNKSIAGKIWDKIIILLINFIQNKEAYRYLIESKNEFQKPSELIDMFEKEGFYKVIQKNLLFKTISFQIMQK